MCFYSLKRRSTLYPSQFWVLCNFFFFLKNDNLLPPVSRLNAMLCRKIFFYHFLLMTSCPTFCLLISFRNGMCHFCITLVSDDSSHRLESVVSQGTAERSLLQGTFQFIQQLCRLVEFEKELSLISRIVTSM